MIIQYNKIAPEHRDTVRSIDSKSYVGYIRYLLLKRWPFDRVRRELMRLGLAWNDQEDFEIYFKEVLYPPIKKFNLTKYYKKYKQDMDGMKGQPLLYGDSFGTSEKTRIDFIKLIHHLDIEHFFAEEIIAFYGGVTNIPNHPSTDEPIIVREKPVDLVEMLQNPKRHVIDRMLVDGYTTRNISDYLFQRYDMELTPNEIKVYARSFFNVTRQDMQRLIDSLENEKDELSNRLIEVKRRPVEDFSFGERFEVLSVMSHKIEELSDMIKKLTNAHSNTAFNAAVLETSDMREMFKDVMIRAHRRFREMDERTEDDVISRLNAIVNMMSKATDKVMNIEEVLSQKATKSINEEMLDVIMPTLERIENEEREAMYSYKDAQDKKEDWDDDDDDILGFE